MSTVMIPDQVRARSVVLQHARDAAEAAELLAMLGLGNDQQDSTTPRGRRGPAGQQQGRVHALSAATEARLASNGSSANMPTNASTVVPAVPTSPARSRAAADRRCEGCGVPVVPQTRYRLDPAGYRQRGVRLLAAKERCHSCYNQLRRPVPANVVVEPEDPRRCGECDRPMVTARVYDADRGRWRERGWVAHAARGLCRSCSAVAAKRRQQTVPEVQVLCGLSEQLGALRQAVQGRLKTRPKDPDLCALGVALADARKHLDAARDRAGAAPNQGGAR